MPIHINDTHSLGGNVRKRKNIRNLMKNNACLKRLMHCPDINNMVNKGKASCYDSRRNKKFRGNEENIYGIFYVCVWKNTNINHFSNQSLAPTHVKYITRFVGM